MDTYFELIKSISKKQLTDHLEDNFERVIGRLKKAKKIKLAFQVSFVSGWIGDDVLNQFIGDDRFAISIVYCRQYNAENELEKRLFYEHFSRYEKEKCKVLEAGDNVTPNEFDIIFFSSPYLSELEGFSTERIPLDSLVCYIPYSFLLADLPSSQFNKFIHIICWRNYISSSYYFELGDKYCDLGRRGMVYSGHPRMDYFVKRLIVDDNRSADHKEATDFSIIYAPHHSINEPPFFSTFDKNGRAILDIAKEHSDIHWIFKPHPLLMKSALMNGVFDAEGWQDYLDEWKSLPKSEIQLGDYMDCFIRSDALILDSVSFLAEYSYIDKPILFLSREGERLNEFGNELMKCIYSVKGDEIKKVEEFVDSRKENDICIGKRREFFDRYLNYYRVNGMLASEYIYRDIVSSLFDS